MRAWVAGLVLLLVVSAGCGPTVDLAASLQIVDVSSGWFDAGIVNGQNKLVPTITFSLKNNSTQKLAGLQVNVLFRRVTEKEEWGSGLVRVTGSDGLAVGAVTAPITVRSQLGYTGSEQSRDDMLRNTQFVDAQADLFAKYGSVQWKRMGEFPITRRLITK